MILAILGPDTAEVEGFVDEDRVLISYICSYNRNG